MSEKNHCPTCGKEYEAHEQIEYDMTSDSLVPSDQAIIDIIRDHKVKFNLKDNDVVLMIWKMGMGAYMQCKPKP